MQLDQLREDPHYPSGTAVYDLAGEKIGTVQGADMNGAYLAVTKGWFFPKDTLVPYSVIGRVDDQGIYLTTAKEDLRERVEVSPAEQVAGELRMPVYEERLVVDTQVEERGRVHIRKEVVTEQQTMAIPLRHERITVERVALDVVDDATLRDAFAERTFDVRVMGEEAVVEKRILGVEEVVIHKDVITVQEQVSDTVRKERVTVGGETDRDLHSAQAPTTSEKHDHPRKKRKHR